MCSETDSAVIFGDESRLFYSSSHRMQQCSSRVFFHSSIFNSSRPCAQIPQTALWVFTCAISGRISAAQNTLRAQRTQDSYSVLLLRTNL